MSSVAAQRVAHAALHVTSNNAACCGGRWGLPLLPGVCSLPEPTEGGVVANSSPAQNAQSNNKWRNHSQTGRVAATDRGVLLAAVKRSVEMNRVGV